MDTVNVDGRDLTAIRLDTPESVLLAIRAEHGLLACGYLSVDTADKLGDALAVVTGVQSYEAMLEAGVKKVSNQARKLGVTIGMGGRDALRKMSRP